MCYIVRYQYTTLLLLVADKYFIEDDNAPWLPHVHAYGYIGVGTEKKGWHDDNYCGLWTDTSLTSVTRLQNHTTIV